MFTEAEAELAVSSTGVGVLGSGSDYTVFVQRSGVRALTVSFHACS